MLRCYDGTESVQRVYFDHNATTPVSPAVADTMAAALREEFGNPSSVHHFGQRAKAVIDQARSAVATLIGADAARGGPSRAAAPRATTSPFEGQQRRLSARDAVT